MTEQKDNRERQLALLRRALESLGIKDFNSTDHSFLDSSIVYQEETTRGIEIIIQSRRMRLGQTETRVNLMTLAKRAVDNSYADDETVSLLANVINVIK